MLRKGQTIWVEWAALALALLSLAVTLGVLILAHRGTVGIEPAASATVLGVGVERISPAPAADLVAATGPPAPAQATIGSDSTPPMAASAAATEQPEDPTKRVLAELAAAAQVEIDAAAKADERTRVWEETRAAAEAELGRWRRREFLVRQQVAKLSEQARRMELEADELARQRDVLNHEREVFKAALAKSPQSGSYAVLPYKGANGTWRRPIVLECVNGTVVLQPRGPTFSLLDLSSMVHPRSSPVIVAIARELLRIQMSDSPDGAPVVPYFVFLVRPDGIRPYYEARARLEPLGISFGYELVPQDLQVDVPDYDDLSTWDGTIPLDLDENPGARGPSETGTDEPGVDWPAARRGPGIVSPGGARKPLSPRARPGGDPGHHEEGDPANEFIWSSRAPTAGRGGTGGSGWIPRAGGPTAGVGRSLLQGPVLGMGSTRLPTLDPAEDLLSTPSAIPSQAAEPLASGGGMEAGGEPDRRPRSSVSVPLGPLSGTRSGSGREPRSLLGETASLAPRDPLPGEGSSSHSEQSRSGGENGGPDVWAQPRVPSAASPLGLQNQGDGRRDGDSLARRGGANAAEGSVGSRKREGSEGERGPAAVGSFGAAHGLDLDSESGAARRTSGSEGVLGLGLDSGLAGGGGSPAEGSAGMMLGSESGSPSGTHDLEALGSRGAVRGRTEPLEVPLEIVVVCHLDGLVVHPGGFSITKPALERRRGEELLVRRLLSIAARRAEADPSIRPRPQVRFLVQNGGGETFWEARRQVLFSGIGWPMSLQVVGGENPRLATGLQW